MRPTGRVLIFNGRTCPIKMTIGRGTIPGWFKAEAWTDATNRGYLRCLFVESETEAGAERNLLRALATSIPDDIIYTFLNSLSIPAIRKVERSVYYQRLMEEAYWKS